MAYYAIGKNVRFRGMHCEIGDLPRDMGAPVRVAQGLIISVFWASHFGSKIAAEGKREFQACGEV
jgi:hypothetical protein